MALYTGHSVSSVAVTTTVHRHLTQS